jgi:hypothetical protein
MTDLRFDVIDVRAAEQAAAPAVVFTVGIADAGGARIHGIHLHVQAQIDPRARHYSADEQARVYALFGDPPQWDRSLRPLAWAQITTMVRGFTGRTDVAIAVPCTYDLEVGASRYLHAVREGEITVRLLFSGTIFVASDSGFSIEQVPWDREARCQVPARLWTEVMEAHFPGCGWLRLRRETLDALLAFKDRQALVSWDETMDRLLAGAPLQEPS